MVKYAFSSSHAFTRWAGDISHQCLPDWKLGPWGCHSSISTRLCINGCLHEWCYHWVHEHQTVAHWCFRPWLWIHVRYRTSSVHTAMKSYSLCLARALFDHWKKTMRQCSLRAWSADVNINIPRYKRGCVMIIRPLVTKHYWGTSILSHCSSNGYSHWKYWWGFSVAFIYLYTMITVFSTSVIEIDIHPS